MNNLEKYNAVFKEVLSLKENFEPDKVNQQEISDWDSVGHMELITALEDAFDIMFDMDDILEFTSYNQGVQLLQKYNIQF